MVPVYKIRNCRWYASKPRRHCAPICHVQRLWSPPWPKLCVRICCFPKKHMCCHYLPNRFHILKGLTKHRRRSHCAYSTNCLGHLPRPPQTCRQLPKRMQLRLCLSFFQLSSAYQIFLSSFRGSLPLFYDEFDDRHIRVNVLVALKV